jgi:hypothetical protein
MHGGSRKLIGTSRERMAAPGRGEGLLSWRTSSGKNASFQSFPCAVIKDCYGHHSEIIHIKRGFKGPHNYPDFITQK